METGEDCMSSNSSFAQNISTDYYSKITYTAEPVKQNYITPLKILNLCANLSATTSSTRVQILINTFIKQITNAPHVLIIPILANNEEGLIQVINDKVLDREIRFTITEDNIKNASTQGFRFLINDVNREFKEFIESLVGIEYNTIFFDINELNKNARSNLPALATINNENCGDTLANELRNCSIILNDDLTLSPINNDGQLKITFFVCIAGDEPSRIYYRYCIYETLRFTIGHLLTAIELDEEIRTSNQSKKLFKIPRSLLPTISDFETLLTGVVNVAKELVNAQIGTIFLRCRFTGELTSKSLEPIEVSRFRDSRILPKLGIAAHVAETGKLLNIRDAYNYPLFDRAIDEQIDTPTKNMLCFPIFDRTNIIGVVQLINKLNGSHFDKCDEEVASAFQTYISIVIVEEIVLKSVQKTEARHKLSLELLIYHMKISEDEVKQLVQSLDNLYVTRINNLSKFTFPTRTLTRMETYKATMQMFADLNFINKFNIRRDKLARFIIVIASSYRDLPYHNWMHAFTVGHFAYSLLMNCKLVERGIFSELEALAFLISTLCHDVDHRGTTNFYQMITKSNMAKLFSCEGSVNERHHLSQTIYVLNDDNCKILDGLPPDDIQIVIDSIKELIIASDVAYLINVLKKLETISFDSSNDNRFMKLPLLMTCCDLSDQVKKWSTTRKAAESIYAEFFNEGDLQKTIGLDIPVHMDRRKASIPRLQIQFLHELVLPSFQLLGILLPETQSLMANIEKNLHHWEELLSHKK